VPARAARRVSSHLSAWHCLNALYKIGPKFGQTAPANAIDDYAVMAEIERDIIQGPGYQDDILFYCVR